MRTRMGYVIPFAILVTASSSFAEPAAQIFRVGEGITCFVPKGYDPQKTPSLILEKPVEPQGEMASPSSLQPEFTLVNGKAGATIALSGNVDLYGGGEVMGPLRRNGKTIELWNTDNYKYKLFDQKRLYQSHPWVLGVNPDGTAFGVIFDSTWRATLATEDEQISFQTQGAPFRVFLIERDSPQSVLAGLAELTGRMDLPPVWTLGYQQSRWSYKTAEVVREIATEFRDRQIPCDVIWMDIDYMDGYRVFTFDKNAFPDPEGLNDYLHDNGFRSVWMIDPGVKLEEGYEVYDSGTAKDLWIKTADGKAYEGPVWPGLCVFPDYTMPETREWWSKLYDGFVTLGMDGVWNDMNEPAVFNDHKTMPSTNWHRGGGDLPAGPHLLYHNAYGMLMVKATREGIMAVRPDRRPFILSRANLLGGHRYAAAWTGDNASTEEHMKLAVPMSLTLGLSGQPFSGPDLGGFGGNCTPELFSEWIASGIFFPFARGHAERGTPQKEPWAFGPETENTSRIAIERRYRLLPYIYTAFQRASVEGLPVMQPVFFADIQDVDLRAEEQAYLVGSDLMVIPNWAVDPELPKTTWPSFSIVPADQEDPIQADVRIRPGAIIPMGQVVQSTSEPYMDELTLVVALDDKGRASGTLYEDAGDGYEYREGDFAQLEFTATQEGNRVHIDYKRKAGKRTVDENRPLHVELIMSDGVKKASGRLGEGLTVEL
ncbi:TIM-barrel domain-containing protein [Cerasicoccus fimbriatus]|uniref:TIM-barrel domain-containing protein n=1 Tax=Cerasicoccus fimbriatus TaxID=3014554 RepID=UPI003CCE0023